VSIDIPWFISFEESIIDIYINKSVDKVILTYSNFFKCHFKQISLLLESNSRLIKYVNINLSHQRQIDRLQLQLLQVDKKYVNQIHIDNCNINSLIFIRVDPNISFMFNNINIKDDNKKEQLSLRECTFNKRFILINSIFNTSFELNNVSFNDDTSFKNLQVEKLDLNTVFFNSDKSVEFSEFIITNNNIVNRSTHRKIKHFLKKESNKIEANRFHSYEMMARKKELSQEPLSKNNIMDKIVFFSNEQVSAHGLNWSLPLFWIFL